MSEGQISRDQSSTPEKESLLQSWKEIAAYLGRDPRTARRWEASDGLPVRRHGSRGSSVYAYPSELDTWRASRKPGQESESTPAGPSRWIPALAAGLAVSAIGWLILTGPILNPPDSMAEAAEDSLRTELVWPEARGIGTPLGSVSPDGRFLTYVDWGRSEWGGGNLVVRDLESGESWPLTRDADNGGNYAGQSRISPDGKLVAYNWLRRSPNGETGELRLLPLDGSSEPPRIIFTPEDGSYADVQDWFGSGEEVAVVLSDPSQPVIGEDGVRRAEALPPSYRIGIVSIADGNFRQIRSIDWGAGPQVRVSSDGAYLAYSAWPSRDSEQKDIYVIAADGSSESVLVEHAAQDEVIGWSPNGDFLLFTSDRSGDIGLWAQPVGNGERAGEPFVVMQDLNPGPGGGVAQDGSFYYSQRVTRRRMKVAAIDTQTGELIESPADAVERRLGQNMLGVFSPDGEQLAYSTGGDIYGPLAIVVRSLATREEREFPLEYPGIGGLSWQPDSRVLAVIRTGGISFLDTVTGETETLAEFSVGRTAQWTADRKRIYYHARWEGELLSFDLGDSDPRVVSGFMGGFRFGLSPDEKWFAYTDEDRELRLRHGPDGENRVLWTAEEGGRIGRWVVFTQDGQNLLVLKRAADEPGQQMWTLWVVPVDGSSPIETELSYEPANAGAWPLAIHPDGQRIVYNDGNYFQQFWALRNIPFDEWGEQKE